MSVEENVRAVTSKIDQINNRDWEGFDKGHSDSVVIHSPNAPEPVAGLPQHRGYVQALTEAFPDLHLNVETAIGQGHWVSTELVMTGTHKAPLPGPGGQSIPATNKPLRLNYLILVKVEGGELTEEHHYFDRVGMMAQLGLME
ncbi:MAG: ester cyclase [Thermoplasmata archaeon]